MKAAERKFHHTRGGRKIIAAIGLLPFAEKSIGNMPFEERCGILTWMHMMGMFRESWAPNWYIVWLIEFAKKVMERWEREGSRQM